jgi:hypothetical protein
MIIDDHPIVQGLRDFNGIPYRNFYGYEFAYESMGWEDVGNYMTLFFSILYAASGLHTLGVFFRYLKGEFKGMKMLRKWSYMIYLT